MKWDNLTENKCPQCGKDWAPSLKEEDGMLTHSCGFKIREKRYKELVESMINGRLEEENDYGLERDDVFDD